MLSNKKFGQRCVATVRTRRARFQAVDLRWGVSEEAGIDQRTMAVCLEEIHRSQLVSPRPNFIVLLGDRYGWRPLPAEIPVDEFDTLRHHIANSEALLLSAWYRRDDNADPPAMALQPRINQFRDQERWAIEEQKLRTTLLRALARVPVGAISSDARQKYDASATEGRSLKEPSIHLTLHSTQASMSSVSSARSVA